MKVMAGKEAFERPKSRRAHRNSTTGITLNEPQQSDSNFGRRRSVPSHYGSPSPRYSEDDASPTVTPRPPTSGRPPSRLRQSQRKFSQEQVFDRDGFNYPYSTSNSRPSTASSLSRYTPLPSIGSKLDLYDSNSDVRDEDDISKDVNRVRLNDSGDTNDKPHVATIKSRSRNEKNIKGQGHDVKNRSNDDKKVKGDSNDPKNRSRDLKGQGRDQGSRSTDQTGKSHNDDSKSRSSKDVREHSTKNSKEISNSKSSKKDSKESVSDKDIKETIVDDSSAINSFKPLKRKIKVRPEPSQKEEKLTLAVKLPAGERIQRTFAPSNTLRNIMEFAEFTAQLDFKGCQLACNFPVKIFTKLEKTIKESGIEDRTIFHIHVPD